MLKSIIYLFSVSALLVPPSFVLSLLLLDDSPNLSVTNHSNDDISEVLPKNNATSEKLTLAQKQTQDEKQGLPWNVVTYGYLNVNMVWDQGFRGEGIVVVVVDNGVDYKNSDLKDQYHSEFSYDFVDDDSDPMPSSGNAHGTGAAGMIAAAENDFCGIGVAPKVSLGAIRMTDDKKSSTFKQSQALSFRSKDVHIYSNSWGPSDSGSLIDGPDDSLSAALQKGVAEGRQGLGNIFVFAAGNGKMLKDDCNYDGYVNSIFTIAVAAVHAGQQVTSYSESCTAILISAYSNFAYGDNVTGMMTSALGENGCTESFGGTSAAAPLVSGVIALMLQVRPELNWRDVMSILVHFASPVDPFHHSWKSTVGKLRYSREYGFGLMNAGLLVEAAKNWKPVSEMATYISEWQFVNQTKTKKNGRVLFHMLLPRNEVKQIEQLVLNVEFRVQGGAGFLVHTLVSPSNIKSHLTDVRPLDVNTRKVSWNFSSVEFWDETNVEGKWSWLIEIVNASVKVKIGAWRLFLIGSKNVHPLYDAYHSLNPNSHSSQSLSSLELPCTLLFVYTHMFLSAYFLLL